MLTIFSIILFLTVLYLRVLAIFLSNLLPINFQVEVTSDGPEAHVAYEELHVLVSADTYEKVDAAVALVELLVTPVSVSSRILM